MSGNPICPGLASRSATGAPKTRGYQIRARSHNYVQLFAIERVIHVRTCRIRWFFRVQSLSVDRSSFHNSAGLVPR